MGVSQGIAEGLMGRCAMKWSTAGTNRVCSRCLALKDTIVGYTDESGVTIPPLHPRCRCAIIYDEVAAPRRVDNKPNKPTDSLRGLAAGNIDITTTEGTPPKLIGRLKDIAPVTIRKTLEYYEAQIVKSSAEHAVIITTTGEVWHCSGDVHGLPKKYFNQMRKELNGAQVTHNHPPGAEENDNTFSNDDFDNFGFFEMEVLRGIDEKFIYELNRNPDDIDSEELTTGDMESILNGEFKDSHRLIALLAKIAGYGYRRWNR